MPTWTLSRLRVEPVPRAIAQSAVTLLRTAGLHGHEYAIDTTLRATARPGRNTILRGDIEDIAISPPTTCAQPSGMP
ncbi:hypothetical protein [Streptomyces gobiensis]|uniref:hypothetical protein n=1 Tax=Streptomyces gobiensis TaxID=2875706 RepID=UPI001E2DA6F5|nr:hypothetical protein [Streptomyces gobiensis]UGY92084.1 hypothetical protein test1122_10350 [Streptomyces gobiensis]